MLSLKMTFQFISPPRFHGSNPLADHAVKIMPILQRSFETCGKFFCKGNQCQHLSLNTNPPPSDPLGGSRLSRPSLDHLCKLPLFFFLMSLQICPSVPRLSNLAVSVTCVSEKLYASSAGRPKTRLLNKIVGQMVTTI